MDVLRGINIEDGSLLFRVAMLEDAAGRSLGYVEWPMAAAESVAAGLDSPALVSLAGQYVGADSFEVRELVLRAAEELGLARPARVDAIECLVLIVCSAVLKDFISLQKALSIVSDLTDYGELAWDLYLAFTPIYDWEDLPQYRSDIAVQVKASATESLNAAGGSLESVILNLTGRENKNA